MPPDTAEIDTGAWLRGLEALALPIFETLGRLEEAGRPDNSALKTPVKLLKQNALGWKGKSLIARAGEMRGTETDRAGGTVKMDTLPTDGRGMAVESRGSNRSGGSDESDQFPAAPAPVLTDDMVETLPPGVTPPGRKRPDPLISSSPFGEANLPPTPPPDDLWEEDIIAKELQQATGTPPAGATVNLAVTQLGCADPTATLPPGATMTSTLPPGATMQMHMDDAGATIAPGTIAMKDYSTDGVATIQGQAAMHQDMLGCLVDDTATIAGAPLLKETLLGTLREGDAIAEQVPTTAASSSSQPDAQSRDEPTNEAATIRMAAPLDRADLMGAATWAGPSPDGKAPVGAPAFLPGQISESDDAEDQEWV